MPLNATRLLRFPPWILLERASRGFNKICLREREREAEKEVPWKYHAEFGPESSRELYFHIEHVVSLSLFLFLYVSLEFLEFFDQHTERRVSRNIFDVLIGREKRKERRGKERGGGIKRRRWISKFGKKYLAGEIQAHAEFWKSSWMAVSQRRSLPDFSRFSIARPTFFPPARQTNAGCQSESIFEITFSRVEAFESFRVRCVCEKRSTMDNEWVQKERERGRSEWGKIRLREFE